MQRIPSTQALQCFEASARTGSFTRAGLELHLTQGGVSRQVQTLERWIGTALLERRREGLKLTQAGGAYLDEIAPALLTLESATAQLMALKGKGGTLSLSIPASWGNHWLIPRLSDFRQANSDVCLNLLTQVGAANFSNRQIDAAVEFRAEARTDASCAFVMGLKLSPYAAPAWIAREPHAANTAVFSSHHMLQHSTLPQAWAGWLEAVAPTARNDAVAASGPRFDLMFMAMNAAITGLGVALLPDFMAQTAVQSQALMRLSTTEWTSPGGYYLSRSPLLRRDSAFEAFSKWLLTQI